MKLSDHPYFPHPRDPATRLGFVVGDLITLSVVALIVFAVLQNFVR